MEMLLRFSYADEMFEHTLNDAILTFSAALANLASLVLNLNGVSPFHMLTNECNTKIIKKKTTYN